MAFWYNAHMNTSALCLYAVPNYHCIRCFEGREKNPTIQKELVEQKSGKKYFLVSQLINETPEILVQYCINV